AAFVVSPDRSFYSTLQPVRKKGGRGIRDDFIDGLGRLLRTRGVLRSNLDKEINLTDPTTHRRDEKGPFFPFKARRRNCSSLPKRSRPRTGKKTNPLARRGLDASLPNTFFLPHVSVSRAHLHFRTGF